MATRKTAKTVNPKPIRTDSELVGLIKEQNNLEDSIWHAEELRNRIETDLNKVSAKLADLSAQREQVNGRIVEHITDAWSAS